MSFSRAASSIGATISKSQSARSLFTSSSIASTSTAIPSTSTLPPVAKLSIYSIPNGAVFSGTVTATGRMSQTATVTVERQATDHKTLKQFLKHKKFLVHDPNSISVVGDKVEIRHCTPVSKRKHFELLRIQKGASSRSLGQKVKELKEAKAVAVEK